MSEVSEFNETLVSVICIARQNPSSFIHEPQPVHYVSLFRRRLVSYRSWSSWNRTWERQAPLFRFPKDMPWPQPSFLLVVLREMCFRRRKCKREGKFRFVSGLVLSRFVWGLSFHPTFVQAVFISWPCISVFFSCNRRSNRREKRSTCSEELGQPRVRRSCRVCQVRDLQTRWLCWHFFSF